MSAEQKQLHQILHRLQAAPVVRPLSLNCNLSLQIDRQSNRQIIVMWYDKQPFEVFRTLWTKPDPWKAMLLPFV